MIPAMPTIIANKNNTLWSEDRTPVALTTAHAYSQLQTNPKDSIGS